MRNMLLIPWIVFFVMSFLFSWDAHAQEVSRDPVVAQSAETTTTHAKDNFPAGFYIYPYHVENVAKHLGIDYKRYADDLMKLLTSSGFTLFHITTQDIDYWLQLAEKYKFQIIAQIDSAYLTSPSMEEVDAKAPVAIDFIKRFKDNPRIIAYSIREEPTAELIPFLDDYYGKIRAAIADAPLFLLHNNRTALEYSLQNKPQITGTDRYAFWGWDASAGGYCSTPASALNWYRTDMKQYSAYAAKLASQFAAVFTTVGNIKLTTKEKINAGSYGDPSRIFQLANEGNQGWEAVAADRFRYVKYYRPPANTIRAMVWLSLLNGAKMILHWSGVPTDPFEKDIIEKKLYEQDPAQLSKSSPELTDIVAKNCYWLRILEPDLVPTQAFYEYKTANEKIQRYAWILNRLSIYKDSSVVSIEGKDAAYNVFKVFGIEGIVVLVVNTNVGTWDSNSVRSLVKSNAAFHINYKCELENYSALSEPGSIVVKYAVAGDLWNVEDGKRLGQNGKGETRIDPGEGSILFIGDEKNLTNMREQAGLGINPVYPPSSLRILYDLD